MYRNKLRVGIWGWWEGKNLGDNWIKRTMDAVFPNIEYRTIYENDFSNLDFIICGGGGLFLFDVIEPWNKIDEIKIPFGALGLGAEFPHNSDLARKMAEKAEFFFVRDEYSIECMGLKQEAKSFDSTFMKPLEWNTTEGENLENVLYVWRDGHEWQKNELFHEYIQLQPDLKPKWDQVVYKHFTMIREDDFSTSDSDIEGRMQDIGFVVTGRFHGVVAAIQMGLPFVAIDICPKIRALAKEAGLEKYCIKISEIDQVERLVEDAKANLEEIRDKEYAYRSMAVKKMKQDVNTVYSAILHNCKKINALHYGSYWMGENDIVNVMADDLAELCNVTKIDLKIYTDKPDSRVKVLMREPNTFITILDHKKVVRDVKKYRPDFVVLNAGGLIFEDRTFEYLRKCKIKTVGIELSDPDVYPYNGAIYAHKFDLYYTNAKLSLQTQYNREKVNVQLMPFAASLKHHWYMPEIERKYDIVVVGHARDDRKCIVDELRKYFSVGTYGMGWEESLGVVNGIEHVKAINSGKIYLSFAKTVAGYTNVKVGLFEAMACNQVVVTDYMEELGDYFDIGKEVLCYKDTEELVELMKYYLSHEKELEELRANAYARFLQEHTYEKRWLNVLKAVFARP